MSDSEDGAASDTRSAFIEPKGVIELTCTARSERSHFVDDNRSVRSRSIANSQLLSETDGNTSSNGMLGGAAQEVPEQWPLDFKDLDEALEASLVDPSTNGSVFIRLLVKTVSVLGCEEDVERLLLENISKRFRSISILRLKDFAVAKLQAALNQAGDDRREEEDAQNNTDNVDMSVHTKLFAEFVASLLDASLLALHRLLYILKLLGIIKMQRTLGLAGSEPSQQVSYAQQMQEVESRAKDQNKRLLLSLWAEIEEAIVGEIRIHLVEQDVENITDHDASHGLAQTQRYQGGNQDEDDDEDNEGGTKSSGLIFRPTARHASALYKKVVGYSTAINRMLKENGLSLDEVNGSALKSAEMATHQRTIAVLGSRPPTSLTIMETMNLAAAVAAVQSTAASKENKVLEFVERFLEEELIPVIQSTANHDMHEIQLNSQHFTIPTDTQGDGVNNRHRPQNTSQDVVLCYAAELCHRTSQPLFDYWLQLTQHRNMVSSVLENVIRGFASAARDEFENLTYGLLSQQQGGAGRDSGMKGSVISGTVRDPLFAIYRAKVCGKATFEELVSGSADAAGIRSRRLSRSAIYDSNNGLAGGQEEGVHSLNMNALELHCWGSFWDVGSARYAISKDKVSV